MIPIKRKEDNNNIRLSAFYIPFVKKGKTLFLKATNYNK